jgi:hypothetical protein
MAGELGQESIEDITNEKDNMKYLFTFTIVSISLLVSCNSETKESNREEAPETKTEAKKEYSSAAGFYIYTADPSAHVFNGRIMLSVS